MGLASVCRCLTMPISTLTLVERNVGQKGSLSDILYQFGFSSIEILKQRIQPLSRVALRA